MTECYRIATVSGAGAFLVPARRAEVGASQLSLHTYRLSLEVERNPQAEAPPPLKVESASRTAISSRWIIRSGSQLTRAVPHTVTPELKVTGTVNPGHFEKRSGDFAGLRPRGGDQCAPGRHREEGPGAAEGAKRGYLRRLLRLPESRGRRSSWPARSWSAPKLLYDKGAISQNDLQVAEDAEDQSQGRRQNHRREAARAGRRLRIIPPASLKFARRSPA